MEVRNAHERPRLIVPIAGLEEKEYPFDFTVDAAELGLEAFYEGPIKIRGSVTKVGSQFFVKGRLAAVRVGECDRCLEMTREQVEPEFALYYRVAPSTPEKREEDNGDDRVRILAPEDHVIALDDEVRQSLRLQVPMKNLCSEFCKGLCPACGANLNVAECECEKGAVDPRWAKLAGLFDEKKDSEKN